MTGQASQDVDQVSNEDNKDLVTPIDGSSVDPEVDQVTDRRLRNRLAARRSRQRKIDQLMTLVAQRDQHLAQSHTLRELLRDVFALTQNLADAAICFHEVITEHQLTVQVEAKMLALKNSPLRPRGAATIAVAAATLSSPQSLDSSQEYVAGLLRKLQDAERAIAVIGEQPSTTDIAQTSSAAVVSGVPKASSGPLDYVKELKLQDAHKQAAKIQKVAPSSEPVRLTPHGIAQRAILAYQQSQKEELEQLQMLKQEQQERRKQALPQGGESSAQGSPAVVSPGDLPPASAWTHVPMSTESSSAGQLLAAYRTVHVAGDAVSQQGGGAQQGSPIEQATFRRVAEGSCSAMAADVAMHTGGLTNLGVHPQPVHLVQTVPIEGQSSAVQVPNGPFIQVVGRSMGLQRQDGEGQRTQQDVLLVPTQVPIGPTAMAYNVAAGSTQSDSVRPPAVVQHQQSQPSQPQLASHTSVQNPTLTSANVQQHVYQQLASHQLHALQGATLQAGSSQPVQQSKAASSGAYHRHVQQVPAPQEPIQGILGQVQQVVQQVVAGGAVVSPLQQLAHAAMSGQVAPQAQQAATQVQQVVTQMAAGAPSVAHHMSQYISPDVPHQVAYNPEQVALNAAPLDSSVMQQHLQRLYTSALEHTDLQQPPPHLQHVSAVQARQQPSAASVAHAANTLATASQQYTLLGAVAGGAIGAPLYVQPLHQVTQQQQQQQQRQQQQQQQQQCGQDQGLVASAAIGVQQQSHLQAAGSSSVLGFGEPPSHVTQQGVGLVGQTADTGGGVVRCVDAPQHSVGLAAGRPRAVANMPPAQAAAHIAAGVAAQQLLHSHHQMLT